METSHGYDPAIGVFQNHSSNIPHLNSWIDHLLALSDDNESKRKKEPFKKQAAYPTTDTLVGNIQRYDIVFKELLRQTSIYSMPLTKLLGKVWTGVVRLLEYMVKSYHRYVRHSSDLQAQAATLLDERQKGEAASKIKEEEVELERTHLRARIRTLEAELESMKITKYGLERENNKMRKIVDIYIQSTELHDSAYDLMIDTAEQNAGHLQTANVWDDPSMKRKEVIDAGRMQLKNLNRLDIEINEILTNVGKEENRQRLLMKDLMKMIERNKVLFTEQNTNLLDGENWGASGRRSVGIQVDCKDDFDVVDDRSLPIVPPTVPPPLAPYVIVTRGSTVPYQLRKKMMSFPKVLRVPPLAWACQVIMAGYFAKMERDKELEKLGRPKESLGVFMHCFFLERTGLASYADVQMAQLLQVCEAQKKPPLPRIALFMDQIGLVHKDDLPLIDVRDTGFVLQILEQMALQGELAEAKQLAKKRNVSHKQMASYASFGVKADVLRSTAVLAMATVFKSWRLPDGGEEYLFKLRSMPHSEKGLRYVDIDEVINLMMEPWHIIRSNWEEHARYLFRENCIIFRAIQEAQFANDEALVASDTIVAEINKTAAGDCFRRPLRNFMTDKKIDVVPGGNSNKEPVVEVMDRSTFVRVLQIINPTLKEKKIDAMFDEALDIAHDSVLRMLETLWVKCLEKPKSSAANHGVDIAEDEDEPTDTTLTGADAARPETPAQKAKMGKEYYVSLENTLHTQWTKPYSQKTFRSQDIEQDAFISVLIRRDVFPETPLLELLHLAPKDIWDNADMFYKQLKEKEEKMKKEFA